MLDGNRDAVMAAVVFLQINVLIATGLLVLALARQASAGLLELRHHVLMLDRELERAQAVAQEIGGLAVELDARSEDSVKASRTYG